VCTYIYNKGTPFEKKALDNINLSIKDGEYIGIIGCTGSGKSTFIQHLNGLNTPDSGTVRYNGEDIFVKGYRKKSLRGKVGLVFQYPEYQLFEATILADVSYGPKNMGMSDGDAKAAAKEALSMVGMTEEVYEMSPFELSGGQKRRAAIAGILAMNPEVLVLDEPTAGLDPYGRNEIMQMINELHVNKGLTIVLVSHSMEDIARYADRVVVLNEGKIFAQGSPADIFNNYKELEEIGLIAPQTVYLMNALKECGVPVGNAITPEEAVKKILRQKGH